MRSDAAPALDVGISPTWSGSHSWNGNAQTFRRNVIGTTNATGIELTNTTAAANGAQQQSPDLLFTAQGYKTNATAGSQSVQFRHFLLPVQGAANPSSSYFIQTSVNGGAWSTRLQLDSGNNWVLGTVGANTLTMTSGVASFATGGNGARVRIDGNSVNTTRRLDFANGASPRISTGTTTSETGSGNVGSDFVLETYSDAGSLLATPFKVIRSSGLVQLGAGGTGMTIGGGSTITKVLTGSASLDFGATAAGTCDTLTITVTGATDGNAVFLGIPNSLASSDNYQQFSGYVSAANTVTVKRCNLFNATTALSDPAAATVTATVFQ